MVEQLRVTAGVASVLAVLLVEPDVGRYGLELMRATGQPSGTLYPILARLQGAGWVRAEWEQIDPVAEGRPARRYYLLTGEGVVAARTELAALRQRLNPSRSRLGNTGTAPHAPGLAQALGAAGLGGASLGGAA